MSEPKPKGRPKKLSIIVHIRMQEELAIALRILAERNRRTVTAEVERIVEQVLRDEQLLPVEGAKT